MAQQQARCAMSDWWNADDFTPRHLCGNGWSDGLIVWSQLMSLGIFVAYMGIPLMLFWSYRRFAREGSQRRWLAVLFAAFIFSCGAGHVVGGILPFYWPNYRFVALWDTMTWLLSTATMLAMPSMVHRNGGAKP